MRFLLNKLQSNVLCLILVLATFITVLPFNVTTAEARNIDGTLSVADSKLFPQLYNLTADKNTLKTLEQFYNETKEAEAKMDSEFYVSMYITAYAENLKKTLNYGLKNAEKYTGDDTYLDDIVAIIKDYTALLDIIIAKANGIEPGKEVTPGFHNFDFSKPGINFSDVSPDSWYAADVAKVSASGIMQGVGNNLYDPDKVLTKAEATILFAKLNAIYYGREGELNKFLSSTTSHWANGVMDYCVKYDLPFLNPHEFDLPCQRYEMAMLIMNAFPKDKYDTIESAYEVINSAFEIKENPEEMCARLFLAGIFMGNETGLDSNGYLTRSQAAALVYRAANPSARIKLKDEIYIPTHLVSNYPSQHCVVGTNGPGYAQKPVFNIKGTVWNPGAVDFTGNLDTASQESYYKYLRYGNHRYFSYNEEQYSFVVDAALNAFEFANTPQNIVDRDYLSRLPTYFRGSNISDSTLYIRDYLAGKCTYEEMVNKYLSGNNNSRTAEMVMETIDGYKNTYNITSPTDIVNLIRIFETVSIMRTYFEKMAYENWVPNARDYTAKYVDANGETQYQDNEVYYYLTKGLNMDCDGEASVSMLIWDTLGFSTRMNSSKYARHGGAEVYLGGKWMTLRSNALPDCTHEELLEDISIFNSVKSHDLAGIFADLFAVDLIVDIPPTHNAKDYKFDTAIPLNN